MKHQKPKLCLAMDTYEATNLLLTKIRSIDPENASRIMGYILIQGLSDRDLLRLAFGPEPLLQNVVLKAKIGLGLPANTLSTLSAPSSPSPLNPISRPNNNNNSNPFSQTSPRITKNGPFVDFATSPPPQPWPVPGLANNNDNNSSVSPKASPFLSYDNIRAGSVLVPPFSKNGSTGSGGCSGNTGDFLDEYQLDEYLSFLDDSTSKGEEFVDPRVHLGGYSVTNGDTHVHRRRFSESDASFGAEDGGFGVGYRPCMYFARGFCKNGDNCNFVHGDFSGDNMVDVNGPSVIVGSPREMEDLYLQQQEELMRMKVAQQQQKWAQSKYMNFVLQQQNDHQRYF